MQKKLVPITKIFSFLITCICVLLIGGNIFSYEPSPYPLIIISILAIFFSSRFLERYYLSQYLFLVFFSLYGIFTVMRNQGGIGGPLTLVTGIIVCLAAQKVVFSRKEVAMIVVATICSMAYWIAKSPTWYDISFYNHWKGDGSLTNPNGVGHYLCYECCFLYILMSQSENKRIRRLRIPLVLVNLWGIYNVKARMGLFTLALFVALSMIIEYRRTLEKECRLLIKGFLFVAIATEIIFPVVYLAMYLHGVGTSFTMFDASEKGLYSGRQAIWLAAFNAMDSAGDILFGVGSNQTFWAGHYLNMHNNAMNLFVIVGVIGLVAYFVYLVYLILHNFDFDYASLLQWQMLLFFICIIMWGMADITLFYNNFLAFYFIPLGVALNPSYGIEEEDDEDE